MGGRPEDPAMSMGGGVSDLMRLEVRVSATGWVGALAAAAARLRGSKGAAT
jgi:hypothetical protein